MFKYGDLLKAGSDLLGDRYCFDRKAVLKTKTANGVTFKSEATLGDSVSAKLDTKFKRDNLSLDKLAIGSDGKLVGELSLSGLADGLDVTFKAQDGPTTSDIKTFGKLGAEYSNDQVFVVADVDLIKGPTVTASAAFKYDSFVVGGCGTFNTGAMDKSGSGLGDYGVGLGYVGDGFRVAARTAGKEPLSNVEVGVYHEVDADTSVAVGLTYPLPKAKGGAVKFEAGGEVKLSGGAAVQAKVGNDGFVSANYQDKLSGGVTLTASAAVKATDLASSDHKFGLKLAFDA